MEKEYAQAIAAEIAKGGVDEAKLVTDLVAHLTRNGRAKLLPGILRELKRIDARHKKLAPMLEAASESEAAHALTSAKAEGFTASTVSVNPALIRGWRARQGSRLVDRSAKSALISMYQKITN